MDKLTAKARNSLPESAFAGPNRSFPVQDKVHARNALARASQFHPELKSKIKAKIRKKFPDIHVEGEKTKHRMDRPHRRK
jgi:hypothetical protein